jgi:hypothetical protein
MRPNATRVPKYRKCCQMVRVPVRLSIKILRNSMSGTSNFAPGIVLLLIFRLLLFLKLLNCFITLEFNIILGTIALESWSG